MLLLTKQIKSESSNLEIDSIIPLFQQYLKIKNPFIRQLLISWIVTLDSVPNVGKI